MGEKERSSKFLHKQLGMAMNNRISVNPEICNGRPVIRGTRILVQTVMEFLGAGDSIEDVLEEYPALKLEDIDSIIEIGMIETYINN